MLPIKRKKIPGLQMPRLATPRLGLSTKGKTAVNPFRANTMKVADLRDEEKIAGLVGNTSAALNTARNVIKNKPPPNFSSSFNPFKGPKAPLKKPTLPATPTPKAPAPPAAAPAAPMPAPRRVAVPPPAAAPNGGAGQSLDQLYQNIRPRGQRTLPPEVEAQIRQITPRAAPPYRGAPAAAPGASVAQTTPMVRPVSSRVAPSQTTPMARSAAGRPEGTVTGRPTAVPEYSEAIPAARQPAPPPASDTFAFDEVPAGSGATRGPRSSETVSFGTAAAPAPQVAPRVAPQAAPQAAPAQAASTQVARDQAVNDLLKRIQAGKSKRTSSTGSETVARNARRSSAANERSDTATIGIGDTGGAAGRVRNQPPPAAQAAPPPAAQAAPPPAAQAAPPPAAQAAPPPAVGIGESIRERLQRFRDGIPSADRVREYVDALTGYESSSAKAAREAAERLRGPGGINPSAEGPPGPSVFSDANPGGLRDYLNAITGRGRYAPDIGDAVGDAVGAPDIAGAAAGGVIPGGTAAASAAGSSDELLDSLKRYAPIGVAGGLTAYGGLRGWGEGQAEVNRSLQQGFNPNTRY